MMQDDVSTLICAVADLVWAVSKSDLEHSPSAVSGGMCRKRRDSIRLRRLG